MGYPFSAMTKTAFSFLAWALVTAGAIRSIWHRLNFFLEPHGHKVLRGNFFKGFHWYPGFGVM